MGSIYQDIYGSGGGDWLGGTVMLIALIGGIFFGLLHTLHQLKTWWEQGQSCRAAAGLIMLGGGAWFWCAMYMTFTGNGSLWAIGAAVGGIGSLAVAVRLMPTEAGR